MYRPSSFSIPCDPGSPETKPAEPEGTNLGVIGHLVTPSERDQTLRFCSGAPFSARIWRWHRSWHRHFDASWLPRFARLDRAMGPRITTIWFHGERTMHEWSRAELATPRHDRVERLVRLGGERIS